MGELRMALEDGRLFITNSRGSGTYTPIAIKDPVILHRAGESALISLPFRSYLNACGPGGSCKLQDGRRMNRQRVSAPVLPAEGLVLGKPVDHAVTSPIDHLLLSLTREDGPKLFWYAYCTYIV